MSMVEFLDFAWLSTDASNFTPQEGLFGAVRILEYV